MLKAGVKSPECFNPQVLAEMRCYAVGIILNPATVSLVKISRLAGLAEKVEIKASVLKSAKLSERVTKFAGNNRQADVAKLMEELKRLVKEQRSDAQTPSARLSYETSSLEMEKKIVQLKARIEDLSAKKWSSRSLEEKLELSSSARTLRELEGRLTIERGGPANIESGDGIIRANNVMVSGNSHYPLALVKKNLDLNDEFLAKLPENASILSIGEGMSDLVPTLAKKFPNTKAVDIWYDNKNLPEELADYVKQNQKLLVTGSSTKLPVPDRSQDLVVSHKLLNNLSQDMAERSVEEMLRVLKSGGTARFTIAKDNIGFLESLSRKHPKITSWVELKGRPTESKPGLTIARTTCCHR